MKETQHIKLQRIRLAYYKLSIQWCGAIVRKDFEEADRLKAKMERIERLVVKYIPHLLIKISFLVSASPFQDDED